MSYKTALGMLVLNLGIVAVITTIIFLVVRIFSLPITVEESFSCAVFTTLFAVYPMVYGMVDSTRKVK
jgi:hypothetical protein